MLLLPLAAACPRQLRREVHAVFPGLPHTDDLLIVPTRQQAQVDLVRTGETVEDEKDKLLEQVRVLGMEHAAARH